MAYNVLIVDDSTLMRSVIQKTLKIANVNLGEVLQAGNGREALALLSEHWVDIVFADINMPEMNGIEMIKRMAQDGVLKTVPVVVISTERSETRMLELRQAGVRAVLNKPFTPECIKAVIDSILEEEPAA